MPKINVMSRSRGNMKSVGAILCASLYPRVFAPLSGSQNIFFSTLIVGRFTATTFFSVKTAIFSLSKICPTDKSVVYRTFTCILISSSWGPSQRDLSPRHLALALWAAISTTSVLSGSYDEGSAFYISLNMEAVSSESQIACFKAFRD